MWMYVLFAFQLFAFVLMMYLMWQVYSQLRRDASREADGLGAREMRAGVQDLAVELRRAAEQINADMTARAATLERLIDQADQRLRTLDSALTRAERLRGTGQAARAAVSAPTATRQAPPPAAAPRPRREPEPELRRPAASAPQAPSQGADSPWPGAPAGDAVRTVPPVASGSPAAANAYRQVSRVGGGGSASGSAEATDASKFDTVLRLANEGMSPADIARATHLGREEVELIVQMNGEGRGA